MRRTQLYLDDVLWEELHSRSIAQKTSISELVRQAVRVVYVGSDEERQTAMERFIGIRADTDEQLDPTQYVRNLRQGNRLGRLYNS